MNGSKKTGHVCHVSHVTCHCHMLYVTFYMSCVTCHKKKRKKGHIGGASRWRVCYQWDLHRRVLFLSNGGTIFWLKPSFRATLTISTWVHKFCQWSDQLLVWHCIFPGGVNYLSCPARPLLPCGSIYLNKVNTIFLFSYLLWKTLLYIYIHVLPFFLCTNGGNNLSKISPSSLNCLGATVLLRCLEKGCD